MKDTNIEMLLADDPRLAHVDRGLMAHIEAHILSRYADFDAAHQRSHAESVMMRSLELAPSPRPLAPDGGSRQYACVYRRGV